MTLAHRLNIIGEDDWLFGRCLEEARDKAETQGILGNHGFSLGGGSNWFIHRVVSCSQHQSAFTQNSVLWTKELAGALDLLPIFSKRS